MYEILVNLILICAQCVFTDSFSVTQILRGIKVGDYRGPKKGHFNTFKRSEY